MLMTRDLVDFACAAVSDVIVEQGEPGEHFFLVESGRFEATVNNLPQKKYKQGEYFGELALLRNMPRAATVRCASEGALWALERTDFRSCVMSLQLRSAAANTPFLSHLSEAVLAQMNDAMFEVLAEPGDVIIQQLDHGDNLYLVESGEYAASRTSHYALGLDRSNISTTALRLYSAGECFGERALMQNTPRAATVTCQKAGRLWALDRLSFRKLIMGAGAVGLDALEADEEHEEAPPAPPADKSKAVKLWQKGNAMHVTSFLFQNVEEKKARKTLRRSPKLLAVFAELWDACSLEDHNLHQEGYLDYHLCLSRGVAKLTGDKSDFDAVDAFDAALDDWERDTKHGQVCACTAPTTHAFKPRACDRLIRTPPYDSPHHTPSPDVPFHAGSSRLFTVRRSWTRSARSSTAASSR